MRYEPVKVMNPRAFPLTRFQAAVYRLHLLGYTVTGIAHRLGVDKHSVRKAISDVWAMDNPKATLCKESMTVGQVLRDELRVVE